MWGILFDILVALMQGLITWEYAYLVFSLFISHCELSCSNHPEFFPYHLLQSFQSTLRPLLSQFCSENVEKLKFIIERCEGADDDDRIPGGSVYLFHGD